MCGVGVRNRLNQIIHAANHTPPNLSNVYNKTYPPPTQMGNMMVRVSATRSRVVGPWTSPADAAAFATTTRLGSIIGVLHNDVNEIKPTRSTYLICVERVCKGAWQPTRHAGGWAESAAARQATGRHVLLDKRDTCTGAIAPATVCCKEIIIVLCGCSIPTLHALTNPFTTWSDK